MLPNDLEKLVIHSQTMRLTEEQSLAYLKANGYVTSRATFYRIKGRLQATKLKRLDEIAKMGFFEQHLERIDQLELIQKEMWKCYFKETRPSQKARILLMLAETQPYLSTYYDLTKQVMNSYKKSEEPVFYPPELSGSDGRDSLDSNTLL